MYDSTEPMLERALEASVLTACSCACDRPTRAATARYSEVDAVTDISLDAAPQALDRVRPAARASP